MDPASDVARHYAHSTLWQTILDALRSWGKDPSRLTHADLAPVDEFHIGGRLATSGLVEQLTLKPE